MYSPRAICLANSDRRTVNIDQTQFYVFISRYNDNIELNIINKFLLIFW